MNDLEFLMINLGAAVTEYVPPNPQRKRRSEKVSRTRAETLRHRTVERYKLAMRGGPKSAACVALYVGVAVSSAADFLKRVLIPAGLVTVEVLPRKHLYTWRAE